MPSQLYTYIPAIQLSFSELAHLINRAYADYYLRVNLNSTQFEQMCFEEDMYLDQSVVALSPEGAPAGLTMLSIRGNAGWISGVGVLPEHRRQGIARAMVSQMLRHAEGNQLEKLHLEVLVQNTRAMALYEQLGFAVDRELLVLSQSHFTLSSQHNDLEIHDLELATALSRYHDFHNLRASWQRGYESLMHKARRLSAMGFTEEGILSGYVLYEAHNDTYAITDLAVDQAHKHRVQVATRLLQAVQRRHRHAVGYTVNIPAIDPLVPAFTNLKYRIWHQQFEMSYDLKSRSA